MLTYHYIIEGTVQGVSFRYFSYKMANLHQITGTVKNLYNGNVEVYAQGEANNLNKFKKELKKGPSLAYVDSIIVEEVSDADLFKDFAIIY